MLTKIEMQYMDAVIGIHKEMRKVNERGVDWEQRRYEIAKDTLQGILNGFTATKKDIEDNSEPLVKCAVYLADALIAELKKEPKK